MPKIDSTFLHKELLSIKIKYLVLILFSQNLFHQAYKKAHQQQKSFKKILPKIKR